MILHQIIFFYIQSEGYRPFSYKIKIIFVFLEILIKFIQSIEFLYTGIV